MGFDAARRPVQSSYTRGGALAFGEDVAWLPRGLRESVTRVDQNEAGTRFAYDPAARLTAAERASGSLRRSFRDQPGRHGFSYDGADNLLARHSEQECADDAVTLPLDGSGRNRPGSVGGVPLGWNAAGRLADKGGFHFSYDAVGRLQSFKIGATPRPVDGSDAEAWVEQARYEVDILGRRVLETTGGATTERVWSGWQEIESYNTTQELIERRTYGLGLDEVVSLELGPEGARTEYLPLYGSSGHVAMLVRAEDGRPVEAYEYSPYGERSVYVNDNQAPALEQLRRAGEEIWVEVSEEVRLEDAAAGITLENVTLGVPLPVVVAQPVVDGRNAGRRLAIRADLPASAAAGEPTWPPRPGEQVRVVIAGVSLVDVWGNQAGAEAGEVLIFGWTGDEVAVDTAAPRLLRVCVRADGKREIELSEEPSVASLGAISVDGVAVGWEVSADGYTLTSAEALAAGSREVVVGAGVADLVGTAIGVGWSGAVEVAEGQQQLVWAAPWPGAVDGSSVGNRLGFHGLPHDGATGLVYARHRDYDPELGRFVQADPLGYVDSVSLYQYGLNNPVNFSDPTGQIVPLVAAGAVVSGGASVAIGLGVARLTGQEYDWADAGVDFGLGAGTFGLDKWFKAGKVGLAGARLWGARVGAEAALDIGGEATRNALQGRESTLGGLVGGAVFNLGIGEAGSLVSRRVIDGVSSTWRPGGYADRFAEGWADSARSDVTLGAGLGGLHDLLAQLQAAHAYARVTAGRHHLFPRALGNDLRYGHRSLTALPELDHTVLQGALNEYLDTLTRTLPTGKVVSMRAKSGNPGSALRTVFSLDERVAALDYFYREFLDGAYHPAFRMELNAARKAGKLK